MKKAISIFLLLIATAPLCQAQGLKDAYRDYWLTGVSVNQWEVAAVTSPTNKHDVTGMVSGDQTANLSGILNVRNGFTETKMATSSPLKNSKGVCESTSTP